MFPSREDGDTPAAEDLQPYHEPTQLDMILADKVLQFRCKRLLDAGLTLDQARDLALDRSVDLHYVEARLIARGCTPDLAYAIAS